MANVRRQVSTTGTVFYQATWSLYDKDGNRRRQTKAFARQSDAKAHAARMEAECERRGVGDVNKQTFAIFRDRVLNFWETRGKLSETSLIGYRRNLDLLAREIGHIQLSKLSALHIDEALAALRARGGASRKPAEEGGQRDTRPLADRTLLHIYRIGSTAMQQAARWKLVAANPFKEVDAPKPGRKKIKIMTEAEAVTVYQRAVVASETGKHPGMDLLVALLLTCGIRRSEVLGLAFDAINLDTGTVNICRTVVAGAKGQPILRDHRAKSEASIRTISLPAELIPMVRRHRQWISQVILKWGRQTYRVDPLLLFPTFGGEPLPPGLLTIRLRQLQRQAKVTGVAPTHGFRHGMASQLVADGVDIRTIADRMGHATASFTLATYVHTVDGKDRAAADRLGEQFQSMKDRADKA